MRKVALLLALLLAAWAAGCKKAPIGEQADEVAAAQQKLAEAQQADGQKLDEIRSQMATIRSAAAADKSQPDFVDDLAVSTRLAGLLAVQASKQQDKEAADTVDRLTRSLAALLAAAPAGRIQEHLERAEVGLGAGDLAATSAQVLAAAGAAYNPTSPALVPDVLSTLEQASLALGTGDAAKATTLVAEIRQKTAQDPTVTDLVNAQNTAFDAADSVRRKAWPILSAQAAQVIDLLNGIAKRAAPQSKEKPAAGAATPEQPTATPAAGAPGAGTTETTRPATPAPAATTPPAATAPTAPAGKTPAAGTPKAAPTPKTP